MKLRSVLGSSALGISTLLVMAAGWVAFSCGGGDHSAPATTPGSGGQGAAGGSGNAGTPAGMAGSTAGAAGAACVPAGEDLPDDSFIDSNCDGIDGDASKAIFVAPNGSDTAAGTMEEPVKTITHGIAIAAAASKSVYVCNGTYPEYVTVGGTAVSLYGGYDCLNGWQRASTARAEVASPSNRALAIQYVTGKVVIDRINFTSSSATEPGASSLVAFVVGSNNVTLSHSDLTAGDGAPGLPGGAVPARYTYTDTELAARVSQNGEDVPAAACTQSARCTFQELGGRQCQNCTLPHCSTNNADTRGGNGGDGGNVQMTLAATKAMQGLPAIGIGTVAGGTPGGAGTDAASGAPALLGFGTVDAAGYEPTNSGADAQNGGMGQAGCGGDGGASYQMSNGDILVDFYVVGGGGGQGGAAGCGGFAGKGGGGGGASIALLVVSSTLSISNGRYKTGRGGAGGPGSAGGLGGDGALGALGGLGSCECILSPCNTATCARTRAQSGGNGGPGGKGGDGGPGAGGPSIPIVVSGPAPAVDAITPVPGSGGIGASALNGTKAADGLSQDQWPRPTTTSTDGGVTDGAIGTDGSNG